MTRISTTPAPERTLSKNMVMVDLFPAFAWPGLGLSYQRAVSSRVSVGPFISSFNLRQSPEQRFFSDLNFRFLLYGVESRFKFNGFENSGAYLSGTVMRAEAQGQGTVSGLLSSGSANVDTGKSAKIGWAASIGYQFLGRKMKSSQFLVDFAAGYGTGRAVRFKTSTVDKIGGSVQSGSATITELPETLFFVAGLGLAF